MLFDQPPAEVVYNDVEAACARGEPVQDDILLSVVVSLELPQCFVLIIPVSVKPAFQIRSYLSR